MALLQKAIPTFPTLSDFFDEDWFNTKFKNGHALPAINVINNEKSYEVELAAPGFNKEDFEISVENGVLTISAKSEKEEEEKKKNFTRKEFSSRAFSNSFTLPENIDADHIEASHKNGVLHLTIQKTIQAMPAKKQVKVL